MNNPPFANYCACFIDLLGQKELLKGQSILPDKSHIEEYKAFVHSATKSIGAIEKLQQHAALFMEDADKSVSMRDQIPREELAAYDEMKAPKPKQQRWSDGLVLYHSLATDKLKCPMNAVVQIFMMCGILCLLGLVQKTPIRGAIEISWGVELHNNELYGAVVANSYILESEVAQYPRIVVGKYTIEYLKKHIQQAPNPSDKIAIYNKNLAALCLGMTTVDVDGHHIVHYLGSSFKKSVLSNDADDRPSFYEQAHQYVCSQYDYFIKEKNTKLSGRYELLKNYFKQNKHLHI